MLEQRLSQDVSDMLPIPESMQLTIDQDAEFDVDLFRAIESEFEYSKTIPQNIPIIMTKSFLIGIGCFAGYPYFNAARDFSRVEFLSWYLGLSVVISNAGLTIWSLIDLVGNIQRHIDTNARHTIKPSLKKKLQKISQWSLASAFGILATLPSTYIAYKFNEGSIFWPGLLFFTDSAINIYSLHRLSVNFKFNCETKNIKNKKTICLRTLQGAIDYFISLKKEERLLLLESKGLVLDGKLIVKDKIFELLSELIYLNEMFQKKDICSPQYGVQNKIMKIIGRILSFSWIIVAFNLAYDGSKTLYDHPLFNIFIALLTVTPASLLEIDFSSKVYEGLSQYTASIIHQRPLKSASTIFFPKLNPFLNIVALLITSFSFGARGTIASNYFSGAASYFLITMIILTTISYKTYSMPRLINELLTWIASFYENSLEADTLKLTSKLAEIPDAMEHLSDKQFTFFYNKVDTHSILPNAETIDTNGSCIGNRLLSSSPSLFQRDVSGEEYKSIEREALIRLPQQRNSKQG
jgi:hypothetical protein